MAERRRHARAMLAGLVLAAGAASSGIAAEAPSPVGTWLTEDKGGVIDIRPCGAALCGYIIGLTGWPANGDVLRDWKGRNRCHETLLAGLVPQSDGKWHGTVTNPEDGGVYKAEVSLPGPGQLRLRGYVGLPLFGSSQLWTPFHGTVQPDCHLR